MEACSRVAQVVVIVQTRGVRVICDYSLQNVASRPAKVGDKLVTHNFGSGTTGFKTVEADLAPPVAVCVMPGTEIAFDDLIGTLGEWTDDGKTYPAKVAIFRQIYKEKAYAHHDALELPDGNTILLTRLTTGQHATVLQLPAAPKSEAEAKEQQRLEVVG